MIKNKNQRIEPSSAKNVLDHDLRAIKPYGLRQFYSKIRVHIKLPAWGPNNFQQEKLIKF